MYRNNGWLCAELILLWRFELDVVMVSEDKKMNVSKEYGCNLLFKRRVRYADDVKLFKIMSAPWSIAYKNQIWHIVHQPDDTCWLRHVAVWQSFSQIIPRNDPNRGCVHVDNHGIGGMMSRVEPRRRRSATPSAITWFFIIIAIGDIVSRYYVCPRCFSEAMWVIDNQ